MSGGEWSVILPALLAGLLVVTTHAPLGREVLARGIIFMDIAIAQLAALGAMLPVTFIEGEAGVWVQLSAVTTAAFGALLLQLSERLWPAVQEALIGVVFVVTASLGFILLARHPHGSEHLQTLLAGQILWVEYTVLGWLALLYAVVLLAWFGLSADARGRAFYVLFAVTITASVQIVGVYLVFASLILPALAADGLPGRPGLVVAYIAGATGYLVGLLGAALGDLPAGPAVVIGLTLVCMPWFIVNRYGAARR